MTVHWKRRLSTRGTLWLRAFQIVWCTGWGLVTLQMLLDPTGIAPEMLIDDSPLTTILFMVASWTVVFFAFLRPVWRLRSVRLEDGMLVISSVFRTIRVSP